MLCLFSCLYQEQGFSCLGTSCKTAACILHKPSHSSTRCRSSRWCRTSQSSWRTTCSLRLEGRSQSSSRLGK